MSLMCSAAGCKEKAGMCKHEKMLAGLVVVLVVGYVAGKAFSLF